MDIKGAYWGLERAEAVRKFRSLKISGNLAAYPAFLLAQERKRNYPGTAILVVEHEAA
jgi:hypothetical protein